MCDLVAELRQCEADTERLLGAGVALRLANWQVSINDPAELVAFVQRLIRGPKRSKGWDLDRKGGRRLEKIVIDCGCPPFTEEDVRVARETLGL